jgi:hypothetical protein
MFLADYLELYNKYINNDNDLIKQREFLSIKYYIIDDEKIFDSKYKNLPNVIFEEDVCFVNYEYLDNLLSNNNTNNEYKFCHFYIRTPKNKYKIYNEQNNNEQSYKIVEYKNFDSMYITNIIPNDTYDKVYIDLPYFSSTYNSMIDLLDNDNKYIYLPFNSVTESLDYLDLNYMLYDEYKVINNLNDFYNLFINYNYNCKFINVIVEYKIYNIIISKLNKYIELFNIIQSII